MLALVVVLCGSLNAQTSRVSGGVQGVVIDESGGVVPGAAVTVEQPEKGFRRGAATDSRGRFLIQGLPSDHYTVRIEQDGFGTAVIEDLVVSLGHTLFQQVELRPAAVTESIEVTERTDAVDTAATTSSAALGAERIEEGPSANRNYLKRGIRLTQVAPIFCGLGIFLGFVTGRTIIL